MCVYNNDFTKLNEGTPKYQIDGGLLINRGFEKIPKFNIREGQNKRGWSGFEKRLTMIIKRKKK